MPSFVQVVTLGGDGTVLWTCGLFRAGAVPPLVPLAMGSLGAARTATRASAEHCFVAARPEFPPASFGTVQHTTAVRLLGASAPGRFSCAPTRDVLAC